MTHPDKSGLDKEYFLFLALHTDWYIKYTYLEIGQNKIPVLIENIRQMK